MTRLSRTLLLLLVPALILISTAATWEVNHDEIELDDAKIFIEFNSTDGDFGLHLFWDGDAWKKMEVEGPNGHTVLKVDVRNNLRLQGLTEGFFESAEPPTTVLSMQQFLDRFPEGEYEFEGRTLGNDRLVGEADLTHILPAPPTNLSPANNAVVNHQSPLVLTFNAVTQNLQGAPLTPELYEVVLETEGNILRVFSITLGGSVANPSVTVPPEFLLPGREYKLEVVVQEEGGNRTISETVFSTM